MRAPRHLYCSYPGRRAFSSKGTSEGITIKYDVENPLIKIENGTFYREYPTTHHRAATSENNHSLFPNLTFSLPSKRPLTFFKDTPLAHDTVSQKWAIIGETGKKDFFDVLRGQHISVPSTARSFPYPSQDLTRNQSGRSTASDRAIQYVGFSGGKLSSSSGVRGAYLSARYESRKEETDWTVLQYLRGETELNPAEHVKTNASPRDELLPWVMRSLQLEKLEALPVSSLSNGQTRRARIAKALMSQPKVLLLDEPFMGLDPPSMAALSPILHKVASAADSTGAVNATASQLVLSLRPQDPIPEWITHLIFLGSGNKVALQGPIYSVLLALHFWSFPAQTEAVMSRAAELTHTFGNPPSEFGNVLTDRGITKDEGLLSCISALESQDVNKIISYLSSTKHHPRNSRLRSFQRKYHGHSEDLNRFIAQASLSCSPDTVFNLGLFLHPMLQPTKVSSQTESASQPDNDPNTTSGDAQTEVRAPLIELENVLVKYGSKVVLGASSERHQEPEGLKLAIQSGTRLAIVGPNGSGKTTLLSLLTSDHPQSYSLPIKFFGRTRLPSPSNPGISLFDVQTNIGHSSPEIHAFFPRHLTIRQTLESAFSDTFLGKPILNANVNGDVDAMLRWFASELNPHHKEKNVSGESASIAWAASKAFTFGSLSFHQQRFLLYLRAIVKKPKMIILDEALSGFPTHLREKAMCFLECGQAHVPEFRESSGKWSSSMSLHRKFAPISEIEPSNYRFTGLTSDQALIVVSHVKEEIPPCVGEWLRLPGEEEIEAGKGIRRGRCRQGQIRTDQLWNEIWSSN
ncbi:MAG: hypothetical protein Q9160_000553 [Pyrenula sp. 1 TL-2023]